MCDQGGRDRQFDAAPIQSHLPVRLQQIIPQLACSSIQSCPKARFSSLVRAPRRWFSIAIRISADPEFPTSLFRFAV